MKRWLPGVGGLGAATAVAWHRWGLPRDPVTASEQVAFARLADAEWTVTGIASAQVWSSKTVDAELLDLDDTRWRTRTPGGHGPTLFAGLSESAAPEHALDRATSRIVVLAADGREQPLTSQRRPGWPWLHRVAVDATAYRLLRRNE